MTMMNSVKRAGFRALYGYLDKDPDANKSEAKRS